MQEPTHILTGVIIQKSFEGSRHPKLALGLTAVITFLSHGFLDKLSNLTYQLPFSACGGKNSSGGLFLRACRTWTGSSFMAASFLMRFSTPIPIFTLTRLSIVWMAIFGSISRRFRSLRPGWMVCQISGTIPSPACLNFCSWPCCCWF